MAGTLRHLQEHERAALRHFTQRLRDGFGSEIRRLVFFGSKSRGDFGPDSDLDLFIVLDDGDWSIKDRIRFVAADISLEYDVLLNTHILSRERWEELTRHRATLWREVERDGVPLLKEGQLC